jgi:anti-sigma regulatory factor (Ser/Thr protein kinase)
MNSGEVTSIHLPERATLSNIESLLAANSFFVLPAPRRFLLVFPPTGIFIEPVALAVLAAWGKDQLDKGATIVCENLEGEGPAYCWRMQLFDSLRIPYQTTRKSHEAGDRFVPITEIITNEQLSTFIENLGEVLHLVDVQKRDTVKYCFSELVRNVLEHAGDVSAFACAQYYPALGKVSVGVADCGRGIRASFGSRYPAADDREGLNLALTPGISGASGTRENAGAGLFFIRSIARYSKGTFLLASGKAGYRLRGSASDESVMIQYDALQEPHDDLNIRYFRGTIVGVDIQVEQITSYDKLMSAIREAYFKDRKDIGKIAKKVKFT